MDRGSVALLLLILNWVCPALEVALKKSVEEEAVWRCSYLVLILVWCPALEVALKRLGRTWCLAPFHKCNFCIWFLQMKLKVSIQHPMSRHRA